MKKLYPLTALLFSGIFLTACGGFQKSNVIPWKGIQAGMNDLSSITDRVEYYDITVESEPIFQWMQAKEDSPLGEKNNTLIGMQFNQGEPIQLWTVLAIRDMFVYNDLYLYRQDGSRKLLLQGYDAHYNHAYLDQKGNIYLWHNSGTISYPDGGAEETNSSLKKYGPSGELLFEKQYDYGYDIMEIRQTENGKMYLIMRDNAADSRRLAELNPTTGLIRELGIGQLAENEISSLSLGIYGNNPATCKFQISGN